MHSDVSNYIAYSGEFLVQRRKHHRRHDSVSTMHPEAPSPTSNPADGNNAEISTNPADYELFIDNESGTYRPNGECLPLLRDFISANFPGLHVTTLDCQKDAERLRALKEEQIERKRREGHPITFLQQSSSSSLSISSSDAEEIDERSRALSEQREEPAQH